MRIPSYLLFVLLTCWFMAAPARAEDVPPPASPAPVAQQQPAPAPAPAPAANTPAPVARKEEDEATAGPLARLKAAAAALTNANGVAAKIKDLETKLENTIKEKDGVIQERETEIAWLKDALEERDNLIKSLDAVLTEAGTNAAAAAQDPAGALRAALSTQVGQVVQRIGVPVESVQTKPTAEKKDDKPATPTGKDPLAMAALRHFHAAGAAGEYDIFRNN